MVGSAPLPRRALPNVSSDAVVDGVLYPGVRTSTADRFVPFRSEVPERGVVDERRDNQQHSFAIATDALKEMGLGVKE